MNFQSVFTSIKRVSHSNLLEWICRILLTYDIVAIMFNNQTESYPDVVIIVMTVGLWFYFLKWKIIGALLFALAMLLHMTHYNAY
jgi:hypothetical protein